MKAIVLIGSLFLLLACKKGIVSVMDKIDPPVPNTSVKGQYSYLALGDSYTIGESVIQAKSFPYQLAEQLKKDAVVLSTPVIIARTGWTTSELQAAITSAALKQKFDVVTLLIGVNNQYRGQSQITYRKEFKELLQTAIAFANNNTAHVFVVSIPDWGVTPFGKSSGRDTQAIAAEIDAFNAINKEETLAAKVSYTDITTASRLAASDAELVADDGLHPSGKMYLDWAVNVAPAVIKGLK